MYTKSLMNIIKCSKVDGIQLTWNNDNYVIGNDLRTTRNMEEISSERAFDLILELAVNVKELQKQLAAKETEIFTIKANNPDLVLESPLPSPPKALEAAKRKGVSLVNPRLRKAGSKGKLDFDDE